MSDQKSQFRKRVMAELTANPSSFSFPALVSEYSVSRKVADSVADELLAQMLARAAKDGVITDQERTKLNRLASHLGISAKRQQAIFRQAGRKLYRRAVSKAREDGVVTDEEKHELDQLRHALGLRRVDLQKPSSPARRGASPQPSRPPAPTRKFDSGEFAQTLIYSANDSVDSVLSNIDELRESDAVHERRAQTARTIVTIGGIGLFVGVGLFFIGFIIPQIRGLSPVAWGGIILGIAGLVAVVGGNVVASLASRLDIEDRRYESVARILRLLRCDLAPETPISATLDFRPYDDPEKYLRSGTVGRWNADYFAERWCDIQGRFADGTKFALAIIEKRQDRHRTKRSMSGKIKNKYKTKTSSELILRLTVKDKRYPRAPELFDYIDQVVQLPGWVIVKSVTADGDKVELRVTTDRRWSTKAIDRRTRQDIVDLVAIMFLSLYQLLNGARASK